MEFLPTTSSLEVELCQLCFDFLKFQREISPFARETANRRLSGLQAKNQTAPGSSGSVSSSLPVAGSLSRNDSVEG
jgi:hypothetical protein